MAGLPNISASEDISNGGKDTQVPKQNEEQLKQWFIGSIDQGTTSTRFLIFDGTGTPIASHQMEFKQIYLHSGLVHLRISSSKTRAGIDVDADG